MQNIVSQKIKLFPEYVDNIQELDWSGIQSKYSWVQDMFLTEQDPIWHGEGNVGIHSCMVVTELLNSSGFKNETDENKLALFVGALMHDIEKRSTTFTDETGRIVSPNHAKRGEYTTRQILYRDFNFPFVLREKIAKLVRHHGYPLWALEKPNPQKAIIGASLVSNLRLLEILSTADVKGRICNDQEDLMERISFFKELALENDCFDKAKQFKSDLGRFYYFSREDAYVDYEPFDDKKFDVIIMCGIPGSGKDYYIKNHLPNYPVVSLDALRLQEDIEPDDKSATGTIIQMAKEQARVYMRKKQSFIWNGTNLTKQIRQQVIDLCESYGGRVKVIYIEVPYQKVLIQNKEREYPIPSNILEKFINKLEMPSPTEAHQVEYIINGTQEFI